MRILPNWNLRPEPPPAGRVKLANPRVVALRWLTVLVAVALATAIAWPRGLGRAADEARREFVAQGYLRSAVAKSMAHPVDRGGAMADIARAMDVAPRPAEHAAAAAQIYLGLRAYREAVEAAARADELTPLDQLNLAHSLMLSGQATKGQALLNQALPLALREGASAGAPDAVAIALNSAAYALAVAGVRLDEARAMAARAVSVVPLDPACVDTMGWVEYRAGRYREAAFWLERGVRLLAPQENAEMYYHLGAAYARLGRLQDARRALRRCLDLDPNWPDARVELEGIRHALPPPTVA